MLPTEVLFPSADAMIADYSSLIYEYLLFGKPLILYVPDLEEYESGRGFYHDFDEIPGVQVLREEELAEERLFRLLTILPIRTSSREWA